MKALKEVLSEANKAYEKHRKENPLIYPEAGRPPFVLGWMETAYERLYEECKSKKE